MGCDELTEARIHLDGAAVVHDAATDDRLLDPTIQCFAFERRPVLPVEQVLGAHRPAPVQVDHRQIAIRADADRPLRAIDPKDARALGGGEAHERRQIPAALQDTVADEDRNHGLNAGHAPPGFPDRRRVFVGPAIRRVVGRDEVDFAGQDRLPQSLGAFR